MSVRRPGSGAFPNVTSTNSLWNSWRTAAPESVVSGLLTPLRGAGRSKSGLVSRQADNARLIMERDTSVTSTNSLWNSWRTAAPESVVSGLLTPLRGAGRSKSGLVSRQADNARLIMERDTNVTSTNSLWNSWRTAAPESVVSGLLTPLRGAGRSKSGLVSRQADNARLIMERDTSVTSTKYLCISWRTVAPESVVSGLLTPPQGLERPEASSLPEHRSSAGQSV
jgi:hypothetical protein